MSVFMSPSNRLCVGPLSTAGLSRRDALLRFGGGLGAVALADLLGERRVQAGLATSGVMTKPHVEPRAKRVIYLFQSGGPSQLETFDYKPLLTEMWGQGLPDSVRK